MFTDNWGGVVLYENADRYCGTTGNSSTGYLHPGRSLGGDRQQVRQAQPRQTEPYYNDCRWKTQNVLVQGNYFAFDPAKIGPDCTPARYCGFNGVFSEWGSIAPFQGTAVENHITFDQNNHFVSNSYDGPWHFVVQEQGNVVNWSTWQKGPYHQDAHSTMRGNG